jgi:hypothetical protein
MVAADCLVQQVRAHSRWPCSQGYSHRQCRRKLPSDHHD